MAENSKIQNSEKGTQNSVSLYNKMHLWMISLIHDSLYRVFVNPYRLLGNAGLRSGKIVLEVGCGPGFFTVPAAKIVGNEGHLIALVINPAAVQHVKREVEGAKLTNVEVILADAARTGLPDDSVDIAFLFGVLHSIKNMDPILLEMHRVVRNGGAMAVQKSSWSERELLDRFTKGSLFCFVKKESRVYTFVKEVGFCNVE